MSPQLNGQWWNMCIRWNDTISVWRWYSMDVLAGDRQYRLIYMFISCLSRLQLQSAQPLCWVTSVNIWSPLFWPDWKKQLGLNRGVIWACRLRTVHAADICSAVTWPRRLLHIWPTGLRRVLGLYIERVSILGILYLLARRGDTRSVEIVWSDVPRPLLEIRCLGLNLSSKVHTFRFAQTKVYL